MAVDMKMSVENPCIASTSILVSFLRCVPSIQIWYLCQQVGESLLSHWLGFDGGYIDVGNYGAVANGSNGMNLKSEDYRYILHRVQEVADICCQGRVVSVLEGGYGNYERVKKTKDTYTINRYVLHDRNHEVEIPWLPTLWVTWRVCWATWTPSRMAIIPWTRVHWMIPSSPMTLLPTILALIPLVSTMEMASTVVVVAPQRTRIWLSVSVERSAEAGSISRVLVSIVLRTSMAWKILSANGVEPQELRTFEKVRNSPWIGRT